MGGESVRVLCDVPSMEVSGETSAAGVAVKGTYVPRVTALRARATGQNITEPASKID